MANPKIIAKKDAKVEQLAKQIKDSKLILLTNYKGITVDQDMELRRDVRKSGGEYRVIKNNIIRRAFEKCGIEGLDEYLEGPTALITSTEDYLAPSKAIYKFAKDNSFYELKAGIIEGELKNSEEILIVAQLPSREELLGRLAGVLLANISKLAVALDAVKSKKEETEVKPEAPKVETKVEKTEVKEEAKVEADVKEEKQEETAKIEEASSTEEKEATEEKTEEATEVKEESTEVEEKTEEVKEDNKETEIKE